MFVTCNPNLMFRNEIEPEFAQVAFNGEIGKYCILEADSNTGYIDIDILEFINDKFLSHRLFGHVEIRDKRL